MHNGSTSCLIEAVFPLASSEIDSVLLKQAGKHYAILGVKVIYYVFTVTARSAID
jgi:hypothetical protein